MESFSKHFELLLSSLDMMRPRTAWQPAADLYRCRNGWLVKFDLAGVKPDEICLELAAESVKVSGTRRDWSVTETREAHQLEIAYSRFERTITLPEPIGEAKVKTEYRDGMFLVQIITEANDE